MLLDGDFNEIENILTIQMRGEALEEAFKAGFTAKTWSRYTEEWGRFQSGHPELFQLNLSELERQNIFLEGYNAHKDTPNKSFSECYEKFNSNQPATDSHELQKQESVVKEILTTEIDWDKLRNKYNSLSVDDDYDCNVWDFLKTEFQYQPSKE